jgi:enoyl-[acyl-carrier protein] reductase/trans-2-enoyl-CoA reductase (NAD+)
MSELPTFQKLPLGGIDRRALLASMTEHGARVAREDLVAARAKLETVAMTPAEGSVVLMLGGSGGILRALSIQLLFAQKVPVYGVHYDSEKLQIGAHHARAMMESAAAEGVACHFTNADATNPKTIEEVVAHLRGKFRVVHVVNGIAAGATKRFAEHGTTQVRDLEIAFDPVRQIVDFSSWASFRRAGLVDVEIATDAEIERTYKFMGRSTLPWAEALDAAGLLVPGESLVAFTDYEYEPDDPVYALGPLAKAKILQRESMTEIKRRFGVRTARLAYPAMNTTALGAIPGGTLMFAGTAQLLLEQGTYQSIPQLARASVPLFDRGFTDYDVRYDLAFQSVLTEFHRRKALLTPENAKTWFEKVFENPALLLRCGAQRRAEEEHGVRAIGLVRVERLVRLDARNREVVRHDPRASLQLLELGNQALRHARQDVERNHGRRRQIHGEDVLRLELHQVIDALLLGRASRLFDELLVDLVADAPRAVLLRGGDEDAPVTAAEVVDDVVLRHGRDLEHLLNDVRLRRPEDHVRRAPRRERRQHRVGGRSRRLGGWRRARLLGRAGGARCKGDTEAQGERDRARGSHAAHPSRGGLRRGCV